MNQPIAEIFWSVGNPDWQLNMLSEPVAGSDTRIKLYALPEVEPEPEEPSNGFERRGRAIELLRIATGPQQPGEAFHPDRLLAIREIGADRKVFARNLGGLMHDALGHIKRVCQNSRTSTRRLRWVEQRADWAIDGKEYDREQFALPETGTSFRQLKQALAVANARIAELESRP